MAADSPGGATIGIRVSAWSLSMAVVWVTITGSRRPMTAITAAEEAEIKKVIDILKPPD